MSRYARTIISFPAPRDSAELKFCLLTSNIIRHFGTILGLFGLIPLFLFPLSFYILHLTLYTLHLTPYTLHLTPYTIHHTPYTLHLTPYTIHHTPYTIHLTPYTLHLFLSSFLFPPSAEKGTCLQPYHHGTISREHPKSTLRAPQEHPKSTP